MLPNTEQPMTADTIVATGERKDCSKLVTALLADVFLMDGYSPNPTSSHCRIGRAAGTAEHSTFLYHPITPIVGTEHVNLLRRSIHVV